MRIQEHEIWIDAAPEAVWQALTDPVWLSRWYVKAAEIDPAPGGRLRLDWGEEGASEAEIELFEAPFRLHLRHLPWPGAPERAEGEELRERFELEPAVRGTRLTLQNEVPAGAAWDDFCTGTQEGWTGYLQALKKLVERGLC